MRQAVRLRAFCRDSRELLVALAPNFARLEVRALHHVSKQVERKRKIGAERVGTLRGVGYWLESV